MTISHPVELYCGTWEKNKSDSDDYSDVLEVQGVSWMTRKLLNAGGLSMDISFNQEQHTLVEKSTTIGVTDTQQLVFDGVDHEASHTLFGKIVLNASVNEQGVIVVKGFGGKSTKWESVTTWTLENNNSKWIRTVEFTSSKLKRTFKYVFDRKQ